MCLHWTIGLNSFTMFVLVISYLGTSIGLQVFIVINVIEDAVHTPFSRCKLYSAPPPAIQHWLEEEEAEDALWKHNTRHLSRCPRITMLQDVSIDCLWNLL